MSKEMGRCFHWYDDCHESQLVINESRKREPMERRNLVRQRSADHRRQSMPRRANLFAWCSENSEPQKTGHCRQLGGWTLLEVSRNCECLETNGGDDGTRNP